ncbi:hypothetical protein EW146_g6724 [Bondarzewia mesenterica]|uniref:Homeobox domain-containing protein n=1 Tax=Bondarzewia mesenterica TaxID=1095465 RepID=A0A4S4LPQ8_9AGAM|nr:hypothetical protein EW146_g6724 [Bondarzewia mesenterica]
MSSGAMQSNVGNPQLYNDGDQRDERSIANRLAAAEKGQKEQRDSRQTIDDPLAPAKSQGHEPSRGAKIDAELQQEEQEYLRNKKNTQTPLHKSRRIHDPSLVLPPYSSLHFHFAMAPDRYNLSRTSSIASMSSDDVPNVEGVCSSSKRTRRRFTNLQLTMLEQLFHKTSHPTREEREELAREVGMEPKSVTIWFQNRRQTERRASLHNATHAANFGRAPNPPLSSPFPTATPSTTRRRVSSMTNAASSPYVAPTTPFTRRPSLDRVATRSELRTAPPRTPSPPPAREYVEFGKNKRTRTLEWACAAARLAGKEKGSSLMLKETDGEETEEEDPQEAITPMGSLAGPDLLWRKKDEKRSLAGGGGEGEVEDDEVMTAALVLCGLGRRTA